MTTLDQAAAWRHLLEIGPGAGGEAGPVRVSPSGAWSCSVPTTEAAATLLDVFAPLRVREHLVIGQLGQSLDGRIATGEGHSHYINGPEDIRRLHRLRALVQAVVVGAGTVASDDPRLTVRHVEGHNPLRVVLDPAGRVDERAAVFTDGAAATIRVRGERATAEAADAADDRVEVVTLPFDEDVGNVAFSPHAILAMLETRGIRRVLVEGGGITVSRFLAARALDRLHVSVAPLLIGSGRSSFTLPPIRTLDEALRPPVRHFTLGTDLLFDLELERRGA